MRCDEKILTRLDELLAKGAGVLATKVDPQRSFCVAYVESALLAEWAASALSLLRRVFGPDSAHCEAFVKHTHGSHAAYFSSASCAVGVLRAAKDDYEHGHLYNVRQLVLAEVLDDFLEQAGVLLEAGFHRPAAVVAGCVLEDGLRKLCAVNGVDVGEKPKMDRMNADLAKKGVFNALVQKKVTWMAGVRNQAAHGQDDQLTDSDVKEMVVAVRRFVEEHLG